MRFLTGGREAYACRTISPNGSDRNFIVGEFDVSGGQIGAFITES